jgi:hypothetical protein
MNFSKSGVSYSFGAKGARVNMGPRGTYVTFSHNGIYYRKKISPGSRHPSHSQIPLDDSVTLGTHTITSSNIDELTDSDSKEFIDELSAKAKKSPTCVGSEFYL